MNGKRPEQVHYIPPGRRKIPLGSPVLAPAPPAPPAGLYHGSSNIRVPTVDSPRSVNVLPVQHARFEPSTTPPLRTSEGLRSVTSTPRGNRIPPQRGDSYEENNMAPGGVLHVHRGRDGVRVVEVRDPNRTNDPFHRSEMGVFPYNAPPDRYGPPPAHMVRNRSYEERYNDNHPHFRSKAAAPPPGWMDGSIGKSPTPTFAQPVRILRNPDREREREKREFLGEHVTRSYVPPRAEQPRYPGNGAPLSPSKAGYVGDNIHSLAPLTTLQERCMKFISSLNPERPDPPLEDEPYEYPRTTPHASRPPGKKIIVEERTYMPPLDDEYFVAPAPDKRRRHRHRPRYPDEGSSGDDCARHMYRLHT